MLYNNSEIFFWCTTNEFLILDECIIEVSNIKSGQIVSQNILKIGERFSLGYKYKQQV